MISSIDNPEAVHEVGRVRKYKEEKGLKSGKARAPSRQAQNSCQEQTQQLSTSEKCVLQKKSRKQQPTSFRKKVGPLKLATWTRPGCQLKKSDKLTPTALRVKTKGKKAKCENAH